MSIRARTRENCSSAGRARVIRDVTANIGGAATGGSATRADLYAESDEQAATWSRKQAGFSRLCLRSVSPFPPPLLPSGMSLATGIIGFSSDASARHARM